MNIQIVLFDGFGELVALAPFEVLKRANECGASFDVEVVSYEEKTDIISSFGLIVKANDILRVENRPDLLIIPGGGWNHRSDVGARKEAEKGNLPQLIYDLHSKGTIVAGVCTGGMLMASSGILKGKTASMHYLAKEELRGYDVELISNRIVDSGDVITSRGVTAGVDLALWIIERFAGANIAAAVESRMEYERRGVIWKNYP
ncbi:DJ-1/PfpI family protein [Bacillus salitolerans]|uniref:DJ-1/PfpI family protein n=1 Tax=Bacillus salitolerans TaxID=1437434 RepID=A0ABW4LYW3_9BACI